MKPVYLVIGIPNSGKDTQAGLLSRFLKLPHLDAGSTFREIIRNKSKYSEYIVETYSNSLPIPSDMFFKIMGEKFGSDECKNGFILSQNTKSVEEAKDMENVLLEKGFALTKVFYLNIRRDVAIERALKRLNGQFTEKEPNLEVLVNRVDNYNILIVDIIKHYRDKKVLVEINGEQSVDDIFDKICGEVNIN